MTNNNNTYNINLDYNHNYSNDDNNNNNKAFQVMMSLIRAGQVLSLQTESVTCMQTADDHVGCTVACHDCNTQTCVQCTTEGGGFVQHLTVAMACEGSLLNGKTTGNTPFRQTKEIPLRT